MRARCASYRATGISPSGRWPAPSRSCPSRRRRAHPEGTPLLAPPTEGQNIAADYRTQGLTLGRHPLALLREPLTAAHVVTSADLRDLPHGRVVRVAGIVTARQRPQSAGGVMFITLEDETGYVNLIVWERVWSKAPAHRQWLEAARGSRHAAEGGAGHPRGGATARRPHAHARTLVTQSRDFR